MSKMRYLSLCLLANCAEGEVLGRQNEPLASVTCTATTADYPVTAEQWSRLYEDRGFYTDGNHLGRDIALAEGAPIRPIACGTIRVYRPAAGYGTLAIVIEHRLSTPVSVITGGGQLATITTFLSIYGHLRPTTLRRGGGQTLPWRVGDTVRPSDIIGYVENANDNGDGNEHLHLGIRLQSMNDAMRTDPRAWFRGYDTNPSQSGYYADPYFFLEALMANRRSEDGAGEPRALDGGIRPLPDVMLPSSIDASLPNPPACEPTSETCDGRDNDCDGQVDEDQGQLTCGRGQCQRSVPACMGGRWNVCREGTPSPEICGNGLDEDCDGVDPACPSVPPSSSLDASVPTPMMSASGGVRYEFRVQGGGWNPQEPYRLRDLWWSSQRCDNTNTTSMQSIGDGWYRCDLPGRLSPFVGSFFDPFHRDWGDMGNLGTIGNSPERCTPTNGVTWRITDLSNGRRLYEGPSSGLPCEAVGSQDRHRLP